MHTLSGLHLLPTKRNNQAQIDYDLGQRYWIETIGHEIVLKREKEEMKTRE